MEAEKLDWLTSEYVQKILRDYENDDSIIVASLMWEPGTAKGDNYGSIMIRAKVDYSRSRSGVESNEKRSLIIKFIPTVEGIHKDVVRENEMLEGLRVSVTRMERFENLENSNIFDIEINMMEMTLEKMNDILNEHDYRFNARILHTEVGDRTVIVMEDLIPLGYRVVNRQQRLDLDHCVIALQGLAKFHASSVALYEKDPNSVTRYNVGLYNVNYPPNMKNFFINGVKSVANVAKTWNELGPNCSEKLSKFAEVAYEKTAKVAKPKDGEFKVLNHGDFWVTNMLFRYDTNGKVNSNIFADFQMSLYTTPAIDLLYFFATSISEDVEDNHRDVLIEKYLETLTSTMQRLGCRTKAPTLDELKAKMREREVYGLMSACSVLPLVLVDNNNAASLDEILQTGGDTPLYRAPAFRKAVVRKLREYDAHGLFND